MKAFSALPWCLVVALCHAQGDTPYTGVVPADPPWVQPDSPYNYPSPNATGMGGWDVARAKAKRFVVRLTVEEKVSLCTGNGFPNEPLSPDLSRTCQGGVSPISRVNFTGLCYIDSDTGIGNGHSYATGFPPGITAASTWNRELLRARGFAIATEHKAKGANAVLGPVLALARTVVGGTNFEGFGADPFMIGVAGYETIKGQSGAGVQSEAKQYLAYDGQQYNRTVYSSNMDDKTLHEIEVWPYAEAVRAGTGCVMTSYPRVNNTHAAQHAYLLNAILKTNLGFQGYTQTDWFGLEAGVDAILAGMDQDMPGVALSGGHWGYFGDNYTEAVRNGSVPEWRLDDAAVRVMTPYFHLDQDRNYPRTNVLDDPRLAIENAQRQRHRTLAREIAAAGTVLLKNTPGKKGLPLNKPTTITLFGPAAGQNPFGPNQYVYGDGSVGQIIPDSFSNVLLGKGVAQGTLAGGGGSGSTFYSRLVDPISAIQQRAVQDLTLVDWTTSRNTTMAAFIAGRGTVCLPVVSSYAGESLDRNLTLLNDGDAIIKAVAGNCDNTIPIIQSVGPVDMEAWIDHPNITAVVWANLGGLELGPALVDVLYGTVNPSGRLVYTIARNSSDYAQPGVVTQPTPVPQINYTEGVSVDYRGFERNGLEPRFCFGHGLSYSTFEYSGLHIAKQADLTENLRTPIEYVADAPGGDSRLFETAIIARFFLKNLGPYDGTEIPQLYLQLPSEAGNPSKILRGFTNVALRDEETKTIYLYLTRKDISYWNVVEQTWTVASGEYQVSIGASLNDTRLQGTFTI